jgi:regulator of replication initiation timing
LAQSSETGGDSDDGSAMPNAPRAQPAGPDAAQDAEAAREKLLKAADQIDMMESNSEANKAALDDIKAQLAKLQDDNTALKLQVSTLQDTVQKQQDALDHMQAEHARERQALIDEVSALIAGKPAAHRLHHVESEPAPPSADDGAEIAPAPAKKKEPAESLAPPPDAAPPDDSSASTEHATAGPTETPRPHKGWIYVVKPHETLTLIVGAFRDQGVKVTVTEVRKANGLTSKSVLKVGQKLFIPKPGT